MIRAALALILLSAPAEAASYYCAQVRLLAEGKSEAELARLIAAYRLTPQQVAMARACLKHERKAHAGQR